MTKLTSFLCVTAYILKKRMEFTYNYHQYIQCPLQESSCWHKAISYKSQKPLNPGAARLQPVLFSNKMFAFHKDPAEGPSPWMDWLFQCTHLDGPYRKFSSCQLEHNSPSLTVEGGSSNHRRQTKRNSWKHPNHWNTGVRFSFASMQHVLDCGLVGSAGAASSAGGGSSSLPLGKAPGCPEVASRHCLFQTSPPLGVSHNDALFSLLGLEILSRSLFIVFLGYTATGTCPPKGLCY